MAAGEYVLVSSQRDAERADIRLEQRELRRDPRGELRELAGVYEQRGLPPALASEVAQTMSRRDALEVLAPVLAHAVSQVRGGDHPRPA